MKKIAIIVDNPKRDIGGMSLLAYHLAKYDIEVYLIPMYEQVLHILAINPDLVLLNYCRPANENKIIRYKKLGYSISVLDTEGGIRRSDSEFYKSIELSNVGELIDLYLTWGKVQEKVIDNYYKSVKSNTRVVCTGTPRYDFLHSAFIDFSPFINDSEKYALIIASFPFCNPKFASPEEEAINVSEALGWSLEKCMKMQEVSGNRMNSYVELIIKLAKKYPKQKFVFRAHPFENQDVYKDKFKNLENITFNDSGEVFSVLHNSKFVLQINSSTGTEAAMANIPVLQPEYMNAKEDSVKQITNCSYLANNENELFEMFEYFINSKNNDYIEKRKKDIKQNVDLLVNDYFYKVDGNSSERAAKEIFDYLNSTINIKKNVKYQFIKEYILTFTKGILKSFLKRKQIKNRKDKYLTNKKIEELIIYFNDQYIKSEIKTYFFSKYKSSRIIVLKKRK